MLSDNYKHSASGGNMYLKSPSKFVWKYGFGEREPSNARMNMGNASEFAAQEGVMNKLNNKQVTEAAVAQFDRLQEGEVTPERDYVGPIAVRFTEALRSFGEPLGYQRRYVVQNPALKRDILGYTDFEFEDIVVDTKATLRCPRDITGEFTAPAVRQQAVYWKMTGKPVALLYAMPKISQAHPMGFECYRIPEAQLAGAWEVMLGAWERIEELSRMCPTAEDATKIIPINPDGFYWKNEDLQRARERWN